MEYLPTFANGGLAAVQDFFDLVEARGATAPDSKGPHNPREFAQRLFAFEAA